MENINRISLTATVGQSGICESPDGSIYCNMRVANDTAFRNRDGSVVLNTCWYKVSAKAGGRISEKTLKDIAKGTALHIDGRVMNVKWTDASGENRYGLEIRATDILILKDTPDVFSQTNEMTVRGTVGNVTRMNAGGKPAARISVATDLLYKDKNDTACLVTTWHTGVIFENRNISSGTIDGLEKGRKVELTGRLRTNEYTDRDGRKHNTNDILASRLSLINEQAQ